MKCVRAVPVPLVGGIPQLGCVGSWRAREGLEPIRGGSRALAQSGVLLVVVVVERGVPLRWRRVLCSRRDPIRLCLRLLVLLVADRPPTAIDLHASWGAWKVRRQRSGLNERIVLNLHEPTPASALPRGAGDDFLIVQIRRQNLHLGTLRSRQLLLGSARWRIGDVSGRARAPRIRLLAQHQHLTHIHLNAASATAVVGSPEKRSGALNALRTRWLVGAGTRRAQVVSERMHGHRRRRGQPLPGPDERIAARIVAGQRRRTMEERRSVLGLARRRGGDGRNGRRGGQGCRGRCGPCSCQ